MLLGPASDQFVGTTFSGGTAGLGTIFSFVDGTSGVSFATLYSFGSVAGDAQHPYGTLVQNGSGTLYGTTYQGGTAGGYGTVYAFINGSGVTVLSSFAGGTDGGNPYGALIVGGDGYLYGTYYGGSGGVFKISPNTPYTRTLLHAFTGGSGNTDGLGPKADLFQASDGYLYGTTEFGGTDTTASSGAGAGTIFRINLSGSSYTQLYSFTGVPDGANPYGPISQGSDGNFYGTTNLGGSNSGGTIYRLQPATALGPPVYLTASDTTLTPGETYTLTYSVSNAYSQALQTCYLTNDAGVASKHLTASNTFSTTSGPVLNTPGTYTITLTCGGVESNSVTVTVEPPPAVTGLMPNNGNADGGTAVQITGSNLSSATSVEFGATAATYFKVNSATSITATSPRSASLGTVDVTVVSPDGTSSTSSADKFTYTRSGSTLALTASPTSSTYGGIVTLTATVNNRNSTGTVVFTNNGVTLGSGTVSGGVATLTATGLPVGSDSIVATYGGDTGETGSTSNTVVVNVAEATSYTALTASPTSSTYGSIVTLTATVNNTAATGTVTFYGPNGKLGTSSPSGGVATLASTALPVGADSVVAVYGGDTGDTGSTSNTLTINVSAATTAVAAAPARRSRCNSSSARR